MSTNSLLKKQCVACRGDLPPLTAEQTQELLKQLPGWSVSEDGKWLHKSYRFKDFVQALEFVNKVGGVAEAEAHHPDIAFGWGYAEVKLQTHAIGGLHENDFIVAAKIEEL